MLVSLQLASNKPENLLGLFANLEATAMRPAEIEVLVKIDDEDETMHIFAESQARRWPFSLRFHSSPRGAGFADLWIAYNALHSVMHPNAYFACLLSDEARFNEHGWDECLRHYVGMYQDNIFRLRTTRIKLRNYYDFWECGFAPDSFAFCTKRWLDIVEGWNPCTGPDSSQQFIAYYLGRSTYTAFEQLNRDIPLFDISFGGQVASEGLTEQQRQARATLNFRLWFRLVSRPMQEELFRRARLLQAAIQYGDIPTTVQTHHRRRFVEIRSAQGETIAILSYRLSPTRLFFSNAWRTLHYHYYAGGGIAAWNFWPINFLEFLIVYYPKLRTKLSWFIDSRPYWLFKEFSGMLARAMKQRQRAVLLLELKSFSARHPGWERTHKIAARCVGLLVRALQ